MKIFLFPSLLLRCNAIFSKANPKVSLYFPTSLKRLIFMDLYLAEYLAEARTLWAFARE